MSEALRDALANFRVISNSLRTNLHDARILHPEDFHVEALDELIEKWDQSVGEIVRIEAALAASEPRQAGEGTDAKKS